MHQTVPDDSLVVGVCTLSFIQEILSEVDAIGDVVAAGPPLPALGRDQAVPAGIAAAGGAEFTLRAGSSNSMDNSGRS